MKEAEKLSQQVPKEVDLPPRELTKSVETPATVQYMGSFQLKNSSLVVSQHSFNEENEKPFKTTGGKTKESPLKRPSDQLL